MLGLTGEQLCGLLRYLLLCPEALAKVACKSRIAVTAGLDPNASTPVPSPLKVSRLPENLTDVAIRKSEEIYPNPSLHH